MGVEGLRRKESEFAIWISLNLLDIDIDSGVKVKKKIMF